MSASIPETMRAAVLAGEAAELEIATIPTPQPKAGEALIKVIACGVCHSDLHVMRGEVAFPRPAVLGHEVSGRIVAIGEGSEDVRDLALGDEVVGAFIMPCTKCDACLRGRDDMCTVFFAENRLKGNLLDGTGRLALADGSPLAGYSMGALAEYSVVPLSAITAIPAGLDAESSSILGCAGLTSYGAIYRAGQVEAGAVTAVVGVGGVGSTLVRMLAGAGAKTIVAVDIADDKLERAQELGATHVVNAMKTDPVAAVRELTGGVDVAFEALGNSRTFAQAVGMLADGGRMVAIGIAAGDTTAEVPITPLVRRGYTITGSFGGRTRQDLPKLVDIASRGEFDVQPLITRRYPLAEANEAYQALARGEIVGRALIVMDN